MSTATFRYKAFEDGKRVPGTQRAETADEALDLLERRGLDVFNIEQVSENRFSFLRLWRTLTGNELATRLTFFRGYAALEAGGVPFEEAFSLLIEQMPPKSRMANAVRGVLQSLNEGERESLSSAMSDHPDEFTALEAAMVGAGEQSKGRAEVLERLATFLERDAKLRKRLTGALMYPAIVLGFAVTLIFYILFYLLPIFSTLYTAFSLPMPGMMSSALALADALKNPVYLLAILASLGLGGFLFAKWASSPKGSYKLDQMLLGDGRIPGTNMKLWPFGLIRRKTITTRIFRAFASLMTSGVDVEKAISICIPVAGSPVYGRAMDAARDNLDTAVCATLSEAFSRQGAFDQYALGFLAIGERVAQIPEMMLRLASYYDDDVETLLQTLPEKIQILVIVILGVVVSYLAYIVYVPIATLSTSVHG